MPPEEILRAEMKGPLLQFLAECILLTPTVSGHPAAESLSTSTAAADGGLRFTMSWKSDPVFKYRVERSNLSPETIWKTVGEELQGNGGLLSFSEVTTDPKMFYRLGPVAIFPPIARVALVGDSITAGTSHLMFNSTGANYAPGGWGTSFRTALGHRVKLEKYFATGENGFAVPGHRRMHS